METHEKGSVSPQTAAIEAAIQAIPPGKVATYGSVARTAGMPNGARQVVRVLNSRWKAADLPWYRLLGKGKRAGTAKISLPGDGFMQQLVLLRSEGIEVSDEGIVDLQKYGFY
jgi:methylated-DNA-protein-cysteine methyltransferase-like protein